MNTPEGTKLLAQMGALPVNDSVDAFGKEYQRDIVTNGALIKRLGVTVD
jgi:hypothetical protein